MRLVAARIGQRLNFRTLSGELGISETILKTYLTVLEKTALVYTCFQNIQRMVEIENIKVTKSISRIRDFAPS